MKARYLFLLLTTISTLGFLACSDNDDETIPTPTPTPTPTEKTVNEITNEWIYDQMKRVYLWNEELPAPASISYTQAPDKFFENILYKYQDINGDRFSWIEEDKSKSKSLFATDNLGFDYIPSSFFTSASEYSSVGLFIVSVNPGSDAEAKGVRRGQVIYQVNGTTVTSTNYKTILNGTGNYNLAIYNNNGRREALPSFSASASKPSPIFLSKVITTNNGIKVGYLMYNAFERNSDDNVNNYEYDIQLIEKIRELGNSGITEFVLDLRYNLGGYLTSAMDLASALVPNRNTKNIFAKESYNKYYTDSLTTQYGTNAFNEYFLDKVYGTKVDIPRLNLNRLYVIATENTASASELVIHGLRPYITVNHIGLTTVGKDKASQTIKSEDKRILWQLQPIISRLTDANGVGNYINGLTPTHEVSEWHEGYNMVDAYYDDDNGNRVKIQSPYLSEWKGGFGELGDPNEPLLAEALAQITGIKRAQTTKSTAQRNWVAKKVPFIKSDKDKRAITIIDK